MSIADLPLTYTHAELLAALEALRPKFEKADARNLVAHRKAEEAYYTAFKKACREALKWDYETLKKNGAQLKTGTRWAPSCPISQVSQLDSMIAMVHRINQPRFTLSRNGKWERIYRMLTADVPSVEGIC